MLYNAGMSQLTISEVARQAGLRPSAIRYYEQLGILPLALRKSGQRRYDSTVLYRLAVIQAARQTGFTLDEIRELFFGFRNDTPPGKRWQEMSQRKLAELEALMDRIKTMQRMLQRLQNCSCDALNECGKRMLGQEPREVTTKGLPANQRRRH
jgi:MerR family transcriptional regulator, redox-sensitive transcriptional activator SoxR